MLLINIFYILMVYFGKNIESLNNQDNMINLANIINITALSLVIFGNFMVISNLEEFRTSLSSNIRSFKDITFKHIHTAAEIEQHIFLFSSLNLYDQDYKKLSFDFNRTKYLLKDMSAKQTNFTIIEHMTNQEAKIESDTFMVCSLNVILLISLNINSLLST